MLANIEDGELAPAEREQMLPAAEQMEVMIEHLPQRDCLINACGRQWCAIIFYH
jgi:hypothetical protein